MKELNYKKRNIAFVLSILLTFTFLLFLSFPVSAKTYNADVVIVGAGGAGMAAAIEASGAGASVIVAEIDPSYGGTAAMSGGGCFAVGTPMQKKKGYEDSTDLAFKDWVRWGQGEADEEWARYYIERSLPDIYNWLESLGIIWIDVNFAEGNTVPRFHRPRGNGQAVAEKLYEGAVKKGVKDWLYNTKIEKIIEKEGRVVGVSGTNTKTGEKTEIYGKAVVMATGGFAGSRESVGKYARWMNEYTFFVAGNKRCTGTGHEMVKDIGGYLTHMDNVWIYVYATPDYEDPGEERGLVLRFFPKSNGIWVNAQGKRFHNEDLTSGATGAPAVMAQNPPFVWSVHDADVEGSLFVMDPSYSKDFSKMYEKKMKLLQKSPFIHKADSLEKLAEEIKIDAGTLKTTVKNYNGYVESGKDPDFGRKLSGLKKIETPPFYAIQFSPAVRKSLGGVKTNLKCQVLDKHFKPIPGLYAAGELTGMAGGHIQGKGALEGTMLGPSIFSGRVAGGWAAYSTGKGNGF